MKPALTLLCVIVALFVAFSAVESGADAPPDRAMAITIDDLPAGAANFMSAAAITEMTTTCGSTPASNWETTRTGTPR